jgi:arylamine N-acetyltransferase
MRLLFGVPPSGSCAIHLPMTESQTVFSPSLLRSILTKLSLPRPAAPDLRGLNAVCAAFSSHISNDNIQKRIWLAGARTTPVTGGDPVEFFQNWLTHGTGGTCFPANGALCALLQALDFDAKRLSGSVLMEGIESDGNHGTVVVALGGASYLVDAQLAAFRALPLVRGQVTTTGDGIHDIRAMPAADGFDVLWYPGSNRQKPLVMRPDLKLGPVTHAYFLAQYALSASRKRKRSPFNEAVFIARHFPNSIVVISRSTRTDILENNAVTRREITLTERNRMLAEELGVSKEIIEAIPPDEGSTIS